MKFKVGDHVVGNKKADNHYEITKTGWRGEVIAVNGEDRLRVRALPGYPAGSLPEVGFYVCAEYFDLIRPIDNRKIVVTADGTTTTARLYDGKTLLKSAEAKCSLKDTFDFEAGAGLAVDRLLGRKTEEPTPKLFPLADIKAGYLIKVRYEGEEFFMTVLPSCYTEGGSNLGCCCGAEHKHWWPLACFGDELEYLGRQIVAVYGLAYNMDLLKNSPEDRKLLWRRD